MFLSNSGDLYWVGSGTGNLFGPFDNYSTVYIPVKVEMNYPEFEMFKIIKDEKNPFATVYQIDENTIFYIEPIFYTHLKGFKERIEPSDYQRIIERMIEVSKKNRHVVFVGTFDFPQTDVDNSYIFLEITDITDPLQIFVEDKSRGSDYGD